MGADYTAIAVIGIEIDEEEIPAKKYKRKAFKHDYPDSMKFSPENGAALWDEGKEPEFTFDQEDTGDIKIIKLPKGIEMFKGTDDCITVLGFGIDDTDSNGGSDYAFAKIDNDIENKLKKLLEPLGMWDKTKFGLYSILYCSY